MSDLVNVTIDGRQISVPKGTLVVEAARQLGIEIPVYCYHPKMAPVGACRVCVVNVENQRRPIMTACTTTVMEGMVVHTRDAEATKARAGILEFLLINHPLDCPVCDRGGECDLQDFTLRYGPPKTRFVETKRHFEKSISIGRNVVLDRERCIMCQRCVRFCSEIAVEEGLVIAERGNRSFIDTFEGRPFDSQFSGNTIEICPVGALTSKTYRFRARPWELQHYAGVCTHCAVGCNLTVDVRFDEVVRFRSRCNDAIDDGWLCDRGRYGHGFIHAEDRATSPMIRRGGKLQEASWDEALSVAAEGLKKAESVGAVAGPVVSNEAGYNLVKLMRGVLKSGNLDHRGSLAEKLPTSARIAGLDSATAVVIVNCNPTMTHPVLDLRIKKALQRGAELIVVGRQSGLDRYAAVHLSTLEGLAPGQEEEPALRRPRPRPWEPGGGTSTDLRLAGEILARSSRVTIVFAEWDPALRELARACGCLEQAPHGLLHLAAGANSVGLSEMGVNPRFAPGWQPLDQGGAYADAWGAFAADEGSLTSVKALLVLSEDHLAKGGAKPDFLVVSDLTLTETAQKADVFLPAASFAEQTQTFTSMDGTVQLSRQAIAPLGESRPQWLILRGLAEALGRAWESDTARAVYREMGKLNPLYQDCSYGDFTGPGEVHWSYPQQGRMGTPRPDLSAIPSGSPDAPPWATALPMGSRVERVARILAGDAPPAVPGQEDPRRVAARMSLDKALALRVPRERSEFMELRVVQDRSAQPPGPSPSERYHRFGVGTRGLPVSADPRREEDR